MAVKRARDRVKTQKLKDLYWTTAQVAKRCKTTTQTVSLWARTGVLPCEEVGDEGGKIYLFLIKIADAFATARDRKRSKARATA